MIISYFYIFKLDCKFFFEVCGLLNLFNVINNYCKVYVFKRYCIWLFLWKFFKRILVWNIVIFFELVLIYIFLYIYGY